MTAMNGYIDYRTRQPIIEKVLYNINLRIYINKTNYRFESLDQLSFD